VKILTVSDLHIGEPATKVTAPPDYAAIIRFFEEHVPRHEPSLVILDGDIVELALRTTRELLHGDGDVRRALDAVSMCKAPKVWVLGNHDTMELWDGYNWPARLDAWYCYEYVVHDTLWVHGDAFDIVPSVLTRVLRAVFPVMRYTTAQMEFKDFSTYSMHVGAVHGRAVECLLKRRERKMVIGHTHQASHTVVTGQGRYPAVTVTDAGSLGHRGTYVVTQVTETGKTVSTIETLS